MKTLIPPDHECVTRGCRVRSCGARRSGTVCMDTAGWKGRCGLYFAFSDFNEAMSIEKRYFTSDFSSRS